MKKRKNSVRKIEKIKRKSEKAVSRTKKSNHIRGWLIPVLLLSLASAVYSSYLLVYRIVLIMNNRALFGVYVSVAFLMVYCGSIWTFLYSSLTRKKKAIDAFKVAAVSGIAFTLWFFLIGQLIINPRGFLSRVFYYVPMLIANIGFIIAVLLYLMKSKRVRKTLER